MFGTAAVFRSNYMSYNVNTIISNTEALLKLRHDETLTTTTPSVCTTVWARRS